MNGVELLDTDIDKKEAKPERLSFTEAEYVAGLMLTEDEE